MSTTASRIGSAALAAVMVTGFAAGPALAKGGDGRVIKRGRALRRRLESKAKPDDGRLEVEFEVDSNRVGQRWTWTLSMTVHQVRSGTRTTKAPSGSFFERRIVDARGRHTVSATARNSQTGEICRASVRI